MLYDRQIKYMDYMVGGERLQSAGFVKAEVRDDVCRMQIHVNGLHLSDSFERKIILRGAGQDSFLKMLRIEDGKGDTGEIVLNPSRMGSGGISYGGLKQIVIPIDSEREIRCIWSRKKERPQGFEVKKRHQESPDRKEEYQQSPDRKEEYQQSPDRKEELQQRLEGRGESDGDQELCEEEGFEEAADIGIEERDAEDSAVRNEEGQNQEIADKEDEDRANGDAENYGMMGAGEWEQAAEKNDAAEDMHITQLTADEIAQPRTVPQYQQDDKWRQLAVLYEHGKVFGEVSDCLLIRPGDFVILPEQYYKLVNNSFLLHGYHNYGYLVLARSEKRGEVKYYVGVPGNFFEKEKQVAIMFGFESFECGKPDIAPGDFGYYMIRVEL